MSLAAQAVVKSRQTPAAETMRLMSGADLARLVQCHEAHPQLHTMLSSAFDAADSEGYASRLDAVTRELIRYCIRLSIYRVST